MQRTIKFRGKRVFSNEWVYGFVTQAIPETLETYIVPQEIYNSYEVREKDIWTLRSENYFQVEADTVGQITGLKDIENDIDIYENDIIKLHQFLFDGNEYENELIGTVTYCEEMSCFGLTNVKHEGTNKYMGYENNEEAKDEFHPMCMFYGLHESSFTVLGNIYENKEDKNG